MALHDGTTKTQYLARCVLTGGGMIYVYGDAVDVDDMSTKCKALTAGNIPNAPPGETVVRVVGCTTTVEQPSAW